MILILGKTKVVDLSLHSWSMTGAVRLIEELAIIISGQYIQGHGGGRSNDCKSFKPITLDNKGAGLEAGKELFL